MQKLFISYVHGDDGEPLRVNFVEGEARQGSAYDWFGRLLKSIAEASEPGHVTHEKELPSGRYIVSEEWPSKAAYMEFCRQRLALDAMLYTEPSEE